jgi:tRNA (guanine37-N1)-methyltransferase
LNLDVFTLFPEHFEWFVHQRHVSNALAAGNALSFHNYRDTTPLGAGQVDDSPYGGGAGMVMRVDVVDAALEAAYGSQREGVRKMALTPSGRLFDERLATELAAEPHLALLCGRYEGFDERVVEDLDRPLRTRGWRASRDGDQRRGTPKASRLARGRG